MSGPRGYSSYHGGRRKLWRFLLGIFLILVILAAAGFLLLQKYLVYDDAGVPHLELPDKQETQTLPDDVVSSSDLNITIDRPEPTAPAGLQALQLSTDPATWQTELAAGTWNGFCVTLRKSGGQLQYASALSGVTMSQTAGAVSAALPALLEGESYAIARVSCLRDGLAARSDLDAMGLKNTGGFVFYDGNNENWLDPAKPAAVSHLSAIITECAALGFDEILLTDVAYPTVGKVDKIAYTGSSVLSENLLALVQSLRTALDEAGYEKTALSVELPAAIIITGGSETAGVELQHWAAVTGRIYGETVATGVDALSAAVQAADASAVFVPELSHSAEGLANYLVITP